MIKILLIVLGLCLIVVPCYATDWTQDANCQACYLFTEGSGNVADNSQNSNTGIFTNSPSWSVDVPSGGFAGGSVEFDGGNNRRVDCGADASLEDLAPLSVVAWFKADNAGDSNIGNLINKKNWRIRIDATPNMIFEQWFAGGGVAWTADFAISFGTWYHIVVTYVKSGTDDDPLIYINGDSKTVNESAPPFGAFNSDSGEALRIGIRDDDNAEWDGVTTEIAIFDKILNSTEINDIMNNGLEGTIAKGQVIIVN